MRDPATLLNIAWRYRAMQEREKELAVLKELSERFPDTEYGCFALGLYYEEQGEAEKAIEPYKKAAEFHGSQRPLALFNLGGRYYDLGNYDSAIKIFEQLVREYKDKGVKGEIIAEAMWYIGRCYEHMFDFPSAIESYCRLLKELSLENLETPTGRGWYNDAIFSIGYCYLQLQEFERAFKEWEQLLKEENLAEDPRHTVRRVLTSYKQVISPIQPIPPEKPREGKTKLLGPIYGIFMDYKMEFRRNDKILLIYGTQSENPAENKALEDLASEVKEYLGSNSLICKKDTEVTEEDIKDKNLVLIGTPYSNKVLASLSAGLPIKIEGETIQVANRIYKGKDIGVIMVAPNPLNKELFVLVYSASQPYLLRNIFSIYHGGTDYIVFSKESISETGKPEPDKPSLEEGYFFKTPDKWEPFPSYQK